MWAPNFEHLDGTPGFQPHALYRRGNTQYCSKFSQGFDCGGGAAPAAPFCTRMTKDGIAKHLLHCSTFVVQQEDGSAWDPTLLSTTQESRNQLGAEEMIICETIISW